MDDAPWLDPENSEEDVDDQEHMVTGGGGHDGFESDSEEGGDRARGHSSSDDESDGEGSRGNTETSGRSTAAAGAPQSAPTRQRRTAIIDSDAENSADEVNALPVTAAAAGVAHESAMTEGASSLAVTAGATATHEEAEEPSEDESAYEDDGFVVSDDEQQDDAENNGQVLPR